MFKEILRFHVEQAVTSLFKRFLNQIEDLREDHRNHFEKLRRSIPTQYHPLIDQADYFDDSRYGYYRKRVLDIGNETKRTLNQEFERHDQLTKE